jgi:hypothetical protein
MSRLFHASETANIECFEPRTDDLGRPAVWAIDETHLPNYLLPRECPRICVRRGACEDAALVERLLGETTHAIYVERAWREHIAATTLFVYEFDASPFVRVDANAGYFQSRNTVRPTATQTLTDLELAQRLRGVAIRYVDSLRLIQNAVVNSTLEFSCIRMRNALLT